MNFGSASLRRRALLAALPALAVPGLAAETAEPAAAESLDAFDAVDPGRNLLFPRDHGAHRLSGIEWWYATGWLDDGARGPIGFQVTFFRQRTHLAGLPPGRFMPRHLLFAHAAISDVAGGRHRHVQRIARWSGEPSSTESGAATGDLDTTIDRWRFSRQPSPAGSLYTASVADDAEHLNLELRLAATQSVLIQGDRGNSRKGPRPVETSHYYSEPQLSVDAVLALDGRERRLAGRGWLDHEWSDAPLPQGAVGWDWIGMNLDDGGALTAFRLRDAAGASLWAGGSWRPRGGNTRSFAANEVRFTPGRIWASPATRGRYPVEWRIETPSGTFAVAALLDAQELDGRAGTGATYWEGLSELRGAGGARVGRGYLEMTGYVEPLRLG